MSLKKNVIVEAEFQHLFDFKDKTEEDNHNASMLMFKFLSEVEDITSNRNISKKKLAKLIGTSASNITQLFRGNRIINLLTLAKLERVLDIEFEISTLNGEIEKKNESNIGNQIHFKPYSFALSHIDNDSVKVPNNSRVTISQKTVHKFEYENEAK